MSCVSAECTRGRTNPNPLDAAAAPERHSAWFQELGAWMEYWDIYHPETRGRYYFGDGGAEPGLLRQFLPRERRPAVFNAWVRLALSLDSRQKFAEEAREPEVAAAILEVDRLILRLFRKHFGDASDPRVKADYLNAVLGLACDTLPSATARAARIPDDDPRKAGAARYAVEPDTMWFSWALHIEAVHAVIGADEDHPRRSLQLAGIAIGWPADMVWSGQRRSRPEYSADFHTARLLHQKGLGWADDFRSARNEVHALFRIRGWGRER